MINKKIVKKNIKIQAWINFLSWITFLVPIITLLYKFTWLSIVDIIIISNVSTLCIWLFELPTSVFADTNWRTNSMKYSVICNFLWALSILLFPNYIWFIVASIFWALYWSFWSGTWQAFLEENLRILWKEKEFWKVIWSYMFYGDMWTIITPIIASIILKYYWSLWYTILAWLDVIFAFLLIILVLKLIETSKIKKEIKNIKKSLKENIQTAKKAFNNVFSNNKLKIFLIYRSLSHHMMFFWIILLPILSEKWMIDSLAWIVVAISTFCWMIASKYAYKLWEKYNYNNVWIISTTIQWFLLIIVSFFIEYWVIIALIYMIFNIFDWLWQPSWNHSLMKLTNWKEVATTRSIIFAFFALYITIWKQLLSFISIETALIILWSIIIISNIIFARKIKTIS